MPSHRFTTFASALAVAIVTVAGAANAQPYGPGPGGRGGPGVGPGGGPGGPGGGPGFMMGSGMMMGPGMMDSSTFGRTCSPRAVGFAEWRLDRLEQVIKPTEAQRVKFEEFKKASLNAAETMRTSCPTEIPVTMPGRMELMEKRLDAMLQSVKIVRPAFDSFYASLTDEQKTRLNTSSGPGRFWRWRDNW